VGARHLSRGTVGRTCQREETCPISTEGWTRRVHFVREGGGGGGTSDSASVSAARSSQLPRGEAGRGGEMRGAEGEMRVRFVLGGGEMRVRSVREREGGQGRTPCGARRRSPCAISQSSPPRPRPPWRCPTRTSTPARSQPRGGPVVLVSPHFFFEPTAYVSAQPHTGSGERKPLWAPPYCCPYPCPYCTLTPSLWDAGRSLWDAGRSRPRRGSWCERGRRRWWCPWWRLRVGRAQYGWRGTVGGRVWGTVGKGGGGDGGSHRSNHNRQITKFGQGGEGPGAAPA
jgi:hypothetical protein